ncbi:hypothetical protein M899_1953 [Bacteriovorax sp. BSW11_IV]|uniref:hypothetical protein n=1 Tax=Bacteriovorax sp. BSW11_IV TaxID=1353529 RepID=UPI00038A4298|nr:hypothetical protein [Bacteriovorax sp. BSW11_IV]EQC48426.1 hypothetical protein M899_1953 [Bacteriovorax sp. BSW11_IV]
MKMIKKMFFFSILFSANMAMATNSIESDQWLKVADGTLANCKSKADSFRHRLQAYNLTERKIIINDETLEFSANINFFQCHESEKGFSFSKVNPYDAYSFANFFSKEQKEVAIKTSTLTAIIYRDGVYKPLHKDSVSDDLVVKSVRIEISDLLNEEEMNKLDQGQSVRVSFDFMINRKIQTQVDDRTRNQIIRYGSFRQWITLKKVDDKILIN